MPDDDAQRRERVIQSFIAFTSAQNELTRLFARRNRLHPTDAAALIQIIEAEELGRPLTPARLAERISLSTGATSILLSRLEDAGHIRRTRENTDRRVVTLHSTAAINELADAFFEPLAEQLGATLSDYSSAALELVAAVADRLRSTLDTYLHSFDSAGERACAEKSEDPAAEGHP
jgi:MarR family transcriptional regulator, organic hydroperoxide resistance regulator